MANLLNELNRLDLINCNDGVFTVESSTIINKDLTVKGNSILDGTVTIKDSGLRKNINDVFQKKITTSNTNDINLTLSPTNVLSANFNSLVETITIPVRVYDSLGGMTANSLTIELKLIRIDRLVVLEVPAFFITTVNNFTAFRSEGLIAINYLNYKYLPTKQLRFPC
jgi:hypothetical protein